MKILIFIISCIVSTNIFSAEMPRETDEQRYTRLHAEIVRHLDQYVDIFSENDIQSLANTFCMTYDSSVSYDSSRYPVMIEIFFEPVIIDQQDAECFFQSSNITQSEHSLFDRTGYYQVAKKLHIFNKLGWAYIGHNGTTIGILLRNRIPVEILETSIFTLIKNAGIILDRKQFQAGIPVTSVFYEKLELVRKSLDPITRDAWIEQVKI